MRLSRLHPYTRRTLRRLVILIPPILLAGTGCARTINRTAERKIRDALPSYIGPARVWRAHVENPPERTLRGRLSTVTIDGEDVRLHSGMTLERLHVEMKDAEVDTRRQRLKSVGLTTFGAVIAEPHLNAFLRASDLPDDAFTFRSAKLGAGRVTVEATYRVLGVAVPFTAQVEPRLASPTRLDFDAERFAIAGLRIPLPASVLTWMARRLTDGFDFSSLPFPLRVAGFRIEPGRVIVEGTADVMRSLNDRLAFWHP